MCVWLWHCFLPFLHQLWMLTGWLASTTFVICNSGYTWRKVTEFYDYLLSLFLSLSPPQHVPPSLRCSLIVYIPLGSTAGCPPWCRCSSWCQRGQTPICHSAHWCACWASHKTWPPEAQLANPQSHQQAPGQASRKRGQWKLNHKFDLMQLLHSPFQFILLLFTNNPTETFVSLCWY